MGGRFVLRHHTNEGRVVVGHRHEVFKWEFDIIVGTGDDGSNCRAPLVLSGGRVWGELKAKLIQCREEGRAVGLGLNLMTDGVAGGLYWPGVSLRIVMANGNSVPGLSHRICQNSGTIDVR